MKLFSLNRNIWVAGVVSFFMDVSSEMVYPLVPVFLSEVMKTDKAIIGLIEGIAESTASVLKVFSGWLSDRLGNRKWLMAAGYGISTLSRPVIALAGNWHTILVSRFIDRFGKGVRTAPRDAIIAESAETAVFGRAFGFHRAMDQVGAVLGPAIAFVILAMTADNYRLVFWVSFIPGALAVLCIVFFIKEKARAGPHKGEPPRLTLAIFDTRFKMYVAIITVFSLGNSSNAFLILKAQQVGIPTEVIPIVYLVFNLVYSTSSIPAGMAADRFGMKRIIFMGFVLFAALYAGFAVARTPLDIWVLFGLYGLFMGLTDGVQKAYLATIIPKDFKATAFGIYNMAMGMALLPASVIGGWLWDKYSSEATFLYGAATAGLSAVLFLAYAVVYKEKGLGIRG